MKLKMEDGTRYKPKDTDEGQVRRAQLRHDLG